MSISELKNNFHNLIDNVDDIELLKNYYDGLSMSLNSKLSNELSEVGKRQILLAYEESEDENNLIDFETVKEKHLKWLSK